MNCPVCGSDLATGYDGDDICPDCEAAELKAMLP